MSKKKLDTTAIRSELSGASAFFPNYRRDEAQSPAEDETPPTREPREPDHQPAKTAKPSTSAASTIARKQASKQASMLAPSQELIEEVRRIVRQPGKGEVLFVRLSREEKDKLADVTYTYKRQGLKTSDNEVMRVAINTLLEDYRINGEQSLLALILAELHT